MVLYTPDHESSLSAIGVEGARRVVDLWAERTAALRARGDVDYVLVFENRGAEVGATIDHPHGQIYAFDHVPARPARRLRGGWRPDLEPGERLVARIAGWQVVTQVAPVFPVSLSVEPLHHVADLPSMGDADRLTLARLLVETLGRLDRLYGRPLPYMMWIHQAPTSPLDETESWFQVEIVSPWREAGVARHIAAAEVACEEYFNPVEPDDIARRLRDL